MFDQLFRQLFSRIKQKASSDAAVVFDGLEQLQFVLFAHARQGADFAFARQFLHAFDIADLVGAPDQCDGFRAQTLNLEQVEHGRAIFLQEFGVGFDVAFFEELQ